MVALVGFVEVVVVDVPRQGVPTVTGRHGPTEVVVLNRHVQSNGLEVIARRCPRCMFRRTRGKRIVTRETESNRRVPDPSLDESDLTGTRVEVWGFDHHCDCG